MNISAFFRSPITHLYRIPIEIEIIGVEMLAQAAAKVVAVSN